jgi:LAO/AO transport system kinase
MNGRTPSLALVDRVRGGEPAAIARLISRAEHGDPEVREALARVYRLAGRAHVIGLTGVPGSGKSTLVARLAAKLRATGQKIGVVAIDPSSPYSGGAILGDRIRMTEMATDPGVYIRSMATRGATGGLARAALDAVDILDVAGFDTIVIETVGVGQDEVEIARASHTTVVVSAPGLGDEIQAIKAGILEIADIHVVSKCDRSDSNRTIVDLKQMLMLGLHAEAGAWQIPVIGTSAVAGQGLDELVDALARHRAVAFETAAGTRRRLAIANFRLRKTAENLVLERFGKAFAQGGDALAVRMARREVDPYSLANELLTSSLPQEHSHEQDARSDITRRAVERGR